MSDEQPSERISPEPLPPAPPPRGRPLLATLLGALVLLLPLAAPHADNGPRAYDLAGKLGLLTGSALFALIVWGVCYAITIRRASRGWKIGSAAILIVLSLLIGMVSIGRQRIAREEEARTLTARLKALADANPASASFDAGADAGPLTRLTAAGAAPILADARRLAAAQKAAGLDQLIALDGLTHASPVLDHCDRVAALGSITDANAARFPVYLEAVRREGAALVAAGKASQNEVDSFVTGMANTQEKFVHQNALAGRIAAGGADLCRILARRNWTRGADGKLDFASSDDLAAAQGVQSRLDPLLAEFNAAREAGVARLDEMPEH